MQLAVYPSVHSQGAKMRDLIDSYPSAFKAMFGMEGVDFTSGPGYLSTETFSLLAPLMLIGLGIALGTGAIATEEERGTKAVRVDVLACSDIHISFKARFDKP
jgi:beta-exotoxin I transport system permease protein